MTETNAPGDRSPALAGTPRPRLVPAALTAIAVSILVVSVAGWCGRFLPAGNAVSWLADLTSHFRAPLFATAAGLGCLALAWLIASRGRRGLVAAVAAVVATWINGAALAPYWLPATSGPTARAAAPGSPDARPVVRAVSLNVEFRNPATDRAVAYLRASAADIVAVLEVDATWAAALTALHDTYPHRRVVAGRSFEGLALLARWPLRDVAVVDFGSGGMPSIVATVATAGGDLTVIVTHPRPPLTPALDAALRSHLGAIGRRAAASTGPCLVMGDLNATPWSAAFGALLAGSGLRDTAVGRGVQPTWNARLPTLRIPIDHLLVSADVEVLDRRTGPDVGSDHLPVEATLALPLTPSSTPDQRPR